MIWAGRICSLLWWIVVIALVLLLFHVGNARRNNQVPQIGGYSIFKITTGSMEPEIPTGMYILVQKTPAEDIRDGDIITFYSEDPDIFNMPNTHRVVGKPVETSRGLVFETRGDANFKNDEFYVAEQRIIGRYCCNLTRLTALVNLFMTKGMLIVILTVQAFSGVMMLLSFRYLKQTRKEQAEAIRKSKEKLEQEIARKAVEAYQKEHSVQTVPQAEETSEQEKRETVSLDISEAPAELETEEKEPMPAEDNAAPEENTEKETAE